MSGPATTARNELITFRWRRGPAPTAVGGHVTQLALVTNGPNNAAGGAVSDEVTTTGYTRFAVPDNTVFSAPVNGVSSNAVTISFGTVAQGQPTVTATHVVGLNAAGTVLSVAQIVNAARTAAAPLVIDTTNGTQAISINPSGLLVSASTTADLT